MDLCPLLGLLQPAPTHMTKQRETVVRPKKITYGHLVSLGSRLTDRDRQIAVDCYDHHVLTTQQLLRLHFDGLRSTTARLNTLYQLRVLDRFRPSMPMGEGTAPYHWVLDEAGAHIVAAREEIERRSLRWRHSDAIKVAYSGKLRHHIEINEFFSLLSQEAEAEDGKLDQWYGERTTHRLFDGITPDGYGVVTLPHRPPVHLLLELDRATEPSKRLRQKAVRYAREVYRSELGERDAFVILAVPTAARARLANKAVHGTGAPITVAEWSKGSTNSPLTIVTDIADQIVGRRLAQARDRPV
jgi:diadenosine tetraphosphatase ApaH/serine/threonine PP2A family protein phosphatase